MTAKFCPEMCGLCEDTMTCIGATSLTCENFPENIYKCLKACNVGTKQLGNSLQMTTY